MSQIFFCFHIVVIWENTQISASVLDNALNVMNLHFPPLCSDLQCSALSYLVQCPAAGKKDRRANTLLSHINPKLPPVHNLSRQKLRQPDSLFQVVQAHI